MITNVLNKEDDDKKQNLKQCLKNIPMAKNSNIEQDWLFRREIENIKETEISRRYYHVKDDNDTKLRG